LCFTTELHAQVIVVPNELAATGGNSTGHGDPGDGAVHVMHLVDASQFGALSGPSYLTQVSRRPDSISGPAGPRTATLRIYASTTSRSLADMSTTFSQNTGANRTLVFDGSVTLSTKNLAGAGDTTQFDLIYPVTTPFLYDPAKGNLLLELQTSSSGSALEWDEVTETPVVRTLLGPGSATTPTGSFRGSPVYQLTFEAPSLVTIRTSEVEVGWNGKSNVTYQVQYRSDLTTNLWTSLVDCIRSTNSTSFIYDPIVVGQPQRFYRVVPTNCDP